MKKVPQLVFVFGTLKRGYPNAAANQGKLLDGKVATRIPYPLYLTGVRHSPWLMDMPGEGFRVRGELYLVDAEQLERMDQLERIDLADGYRRQRIEIIMSDYSLNSAWAYLKPVSQLRNTSIMSGPLRSYTPAHASLYRSRCSG